MTNEIKPLDTAAAGLALPKAINCYQQLNAEDWQITEVSTSHQVFMVTVRDRPFPRQVCETTELSAILLPLNPSALRQLDRIVGQCFFVGTCLFLIRKCEVELTQDWDRVCIDATAIWRQEDASDSDAHDKLFNNDHD